MTSGENLNGLIDQRPFLDSLADKMMAKYGNETDNGEVIDLSSMQVVKARRRSMPVKYAPPKSQVKKAKQRSKTITYTKHETIKVRPNSSSGVEVSQTQCTALARLNDSTFSCSVFTKHINRPATTNQEFQNMELSEIYNALLQGDTELANLLCCIVQTTLKGAPCLPSQIPLPKLPSHSVPIFRIDKDRVPYFILLYRDPQSAEASSKMLKDINKDICQKSFLIYELLLKFQSGENDQNCEQEQHSSNIEQQQKLLNQYLKTLVLNKEVLQVARQHLEDLYGKDLPNPIIFDVIVQIDAFYKPLFKFFAFPKTAPFELTDSLPDYDKTIISFSKQIYCLIYSSNLSSKTTMSKSVRTRM